MSGRRTIQSRDSPFSIGMADDSTFAFAGLWESWTDPGGGVVETCTILTHHAECPSCRRS